VVRAVDQTKLTAQRGFFDEITLGAAIPALLLKAKKKKTALSLTR
jgi:hypothetical protein